jgi:hypothetical protein
MPANTACADVAPNASTIRGRCAAIADVTVHAAANANERRTIVRSNAICGFTRGPLDETIRSVRGSSRLRGNPITI